MKSLVEFINENLNNKQHKSLIKAIESRNPNTFITACKKIVDDNKDDLINSEDIDDLEDGTFFGYLTNNMGETTAQIAIMSRTSIYDEPSKERKQWVILTVDGRKGSKDSNKFVVDLDNEEKLHTNYFGNAWKIIYDEHTNEELIDAIIKIKF